MFTLVVLDLTHSLGYLHRELSRPRGCPFGGPTPAGSSRGGDILGFGIECSLNTGPLNLESVALTTEPWSCEIM
ncbi:hypothetical protein DAPPUDRAFT_261534 [Daphnia pulex]|uniref:Uncharacterized protein n=1 Tax=Daphnia pulex TaxID=6669 RepID=E9HL65_DAPPU|nr:hypothetical protein DAPPUDRAFT_261534 [Daphnia pulex]|eukprot:EFX67518.1 hypothetical protein DAPPUDRAFT_261534 [Daphnia pulex]